MVQGKKFNDMSNGIKLQQNNMSLSRKDMGTTRGGAQARTMEKLRMVCLRSVAHASSLISLGNASSFRTDSAISGNRSGGERVLQRWQADGPDGIDISLDEPGSNTHSSVPWDQFAENTRRFGLTTDYDENIYTTTIDKSHPHYERRLAEAEKKEREILRSAANNSHIAEERIKDHLASAGTGAGEEEKYAINESPNLQFAIANASRYSGVRKDFPPLISSSDKYTPPARRAPAGQTNVTGATVDPAIISSQLARPDKLAADKGKAAPAAKSNKPDVAVPSATKESSVATPEAKPTTTNASASASRITSPNIKTEGAPNATATVERDVASSFKVFAAQQRKNVDQIRRDKLRNDKEIKLNDLKKFADNFKLNTPVPSDLVSIIAKDPAKQKDIQEKAKRNAEEAKANPADAVKPVVPMSDSKTMQQRVPTASNHTASPSGPANRHNNSSGRGNYPHHHPPSYNPRSSGQQSMTSQPRPANLGARLRGIEQSKMVRQHPAASSAHETRLPPTGPSTAMDPNLLARYNGVTSAQIGRLNPNSSEFRPNPFANSFNPTTNPSSGSSPRSTINAVEKRATPPVSRSFLHRKILAESERPSLKDKFDALGHIYAIKPAEGKSWKATGGLKPAYDTPPTWRTIANDEPSNSTMHLTYVKLFEMAPFPTAMSPPMSSAVPQVPHQHQLPFHLQHGIHNMSARQSPRQTHMNVHAGQHGHGSNASYNGPDDHRMMPSHSAQSFASPRVAHASLGYPSPMNQPAQLAYNTPVMPWGGAPPMAPYRSLSQNQQFMPHQPHGPLMMNNGNSFIAAQGLPPAPQIMYPQVGQGHFMQPSNVHQPGMPVNGFPSPGRSAPMMINHGSQQGHQPLYGSPGFQYSNGGPIYAQAPNQVPMRGYPGGGSNQFGTSPQGHYGLPNRYNHPNGNYNNKYQHHNQHNVPANSTLSGPPTRGAEGGDEAK